jgi:hypothetical protein
MWNYNPGFRVPMWEWNHIFWCSVFLQNCVDTHETKKSSFYATWMYITLFITKTHYLALMLNQLNAINKQSPHFWKSSLMLPSHPWLGFPNHSPFLAKSKLMKLPLRNFLWLNFTLFPQDPNILQTNMSFQKNGIGYSSLSLVRWACISLKCSEYFPAKLPFEKEISRTKMK